MNPDQRLGVAVGWFCTARRSAALATLAAVLIGIRALLPTVSISPGGTLHEQRSNYKTAEAPARLKNSSSPGKDGRAGSDGKAGRDIKNRMAGGDGHAVQGNRSSKAGRHDSKVEINSLSQKSSTATPGNHRAASSTSRAPVDGLHHQHKAGHPSPKLQAAPSPQLRQQAAGHPTSRPHAAHPTPKPHAVLPDLRKPHAVLGGQPHPGSGMGHPTPKPQAPLGNKQHPGHASYATLAPAPGSQHVIRHSEQPTGVIIPPRGHRVVGSLPAGCNTATALAGGKCYEAVKLARDHPERYPGLSTCSTLEEIQDHLSRLSGSARQECSAPCQAEPLPDSFSRCHIPVAGEWCYEAVEWALLYGIRDYPQWYPGLSWWNNFEDFQRLLHKGGWGKNHNEPPRYAGCGPPCEAPWPDAERPMRATPDGVCMYELPTKFNLELRDSVFRQREPKARPLKLADYHLWGLHEQNQYALERVFYDRMQAATTTLRMPAACQIFYVPYFTEWETGDVKGVWRNAERPWLEEELLKHIVHYGNHRRRRCNSETHFNDHFVVLGRVSANGYSFLNNRRFENMVKLSIEDTHPGRWKNVVAVPYPTWFRYDPELEPPSDGPHHVELLELNCQSIKDTALNVCYKKVACGIDLRWAACGDIWYLKGKYRCGNTVREIDLDLRDLGRTRLVLSCRIGPCWLSWTCDEICEHDYPITSKSTRIDTWEEFQRIENEDGSFSLKTWHGKYISAADNGEVKAMGEYVGWWEKFWETKHEDGLVSVRSWHGSYLSTGQAGEVMAIKGDIRAWSKFGKEQRAPGKLALRGFQGKYLTAEKQCGKIWGNMALPPVMIIGSAKPWEVPRKKIIEHCTSRPRDCFYWGTGSRDKTSGNMQDKIGRLAELLGTSLFCINPPGDTPTRKGIFDSLVLGCIPVITDQKSLEYYRWHLGDWWSVCVHVYWDITDPGFNIVDYLMQLKETDRAGVQWKLSQIQKLAYALQYSMKAPAQGHRGPDALEVSLQKLLEWSRSQR